MCKWQAAFLCSRLRSENVSHLRSTLLGANKIFFLFISCLTFFPSFQHCVPLPGTAHFTFDLFVLLLLLLRMQNF